MGGDITQQAQALEEMLKIFRNSAIETITSYNTVIEQVEYEIGEDKMSGFQPITIPSRTNDSQGIPKPPPGFNLD